MFYYFYLISRQTSEEAIASSSELTKPRKILRSRTQNQSLKLDDRPSIKNKHLLGRKLARTASENEHLRKDQIVTIENSENENWRNSKVRFEIPEIKVSNPDDS